MHLIEDTSDTPEPETPFSGGDEQLKTNDSVDHVPDLSEMASKEDHQLSLPESNLSADSDRSSRQAFALAVPASNTSINSEISATNEYVLAVSQSFDSVTSPKETLASSSHLPSNPSLHEDQADDNLFARWDKTASAASVSSKRSLPRKNVNNMRGRAPKPAAKPTMWTSAHTMAAPQKASLKALRDAQSGTASRASPAAVTLEAFRPGSVTVQLNEDIPSENPQTDKDGHSEAT